MTVTSNDTVCVCVVCVCGVCMWRVCGVCLWCVYVACVFVVCVYVCVVCMCVLCVCVCGVCTWVFVRVVCVRCVCCVCMCVYVCDVCVCVVCGVSDFQLLEFNQTSYERYCTVRYTAVITIWRCVEHVKRKRRNCAAVGISSQHTMTVLVLRSGHVCRQAKAA